MSTPAPTQAPVPPPSPFKGSPFLHIASLCQGAESFVEGLVDKEPVINMFVQYLMQMLAAHQASKQFPVAPSAPVATTTSPTASSEAAPSSQP